MNNHINVIKFVDREILTIILDEIGHLMNKFLYV